MRSPRRPALIAGALIATLLAGCGSGTDDDEPGGGSASDEPQSGGSLTFLVPNEPAQMHPGQLGNSYAVSSAYGNAVYGQLVRTDEVTGELELGMAANLSGTPDGATWTLDLRPDLTFSDGTPLDAGAVKFNWDQLKAPGVATGSNLGPALTIASTAVVDADTLEIVLAKPTGQFGQTIAASALNWIGSPTAMADSAAFSSAPVGAGPFVVESWRRGGEMVLARNPDYYDAPRPYLDELVLRADNDGSRRLTVLQAGEVDLVVGTDASTAHEAEESGLLVERAAINGVNYVMFNQSTAPFDDPRAREAVVLAVDPELINQAMSQGRGEVPEGLFASSSPFHEEDLTFPDHDAERAQELFDELAAEGRPVTMNLLATPAADSQAIVGSIQTQLRAFDNVEIETETLDQAAWLTQLLQGTWEASVFGAPFIDPEPVLRNNFHSQSRANFARIADPALDAALDSGALSQDPEERRDAYRTAQERIIELDALIAYSRPPISYLSSPDVGGHDFYGQGSTPVDTLWLRDPDA